MTNIESEIDELLKKFHLNMTSEWDGLPTQEAVAQAKQALIELVAKERLALLHEIYWAVDIANLHQNNHYDAQDAVQAKIDALSSNKQGGSDGKR